MSEGATHGSLPPESPVIRITWPGGSAEADPASFQEAVERALGASPEWVVLETSKILGSECVSLEPLKQEAERRLAGLPEVPWLGVEADVVCSGGRPYGVMRVRIRIGELGKEEARSVVLFFAYVLAGRKRDALRVALRGGFPPFGR